MRSLKRAAFAVMTTAALAAASVVPAHAAPPVEAAPTPLVSSVLPAVHSMTQEDSVDSQTSSESGVRVATYNASLFGGAEGELIGDLVSPNNSQAQAVAEVIQRTAPDVLLVNEFDYDAEKTAASLFRDNYLAVSQNDQPAQDYPYMYVAPSNTGVQTGADLNQDGTVGGPDDAFGYGEFEGQYGMVLYSKYPILTDEVRTFQKFLWSDMPESNLPTDYYGELISGVLRLSSKSHWDVPIDVDGRTVHMLAAHPTPPAFDGAEQRNARRNHDEIRFFADYISGGEASAYIYDDAGVRGGLAEGEDFVVLGDLNADPQRGDSYDNAVMSLLSHESITDPEPSSRGPVANGRPTIGSFLQRGAPQSEGYRSRTLRTADFGGSTGALRVDYVLPSKTLGVNDAGVFWPAPNQPGADLIGMNPVRSSDHRLVWVDLETR
ncbi:endonuclease/exonuclease/phosphatase family protein [Zhihengliuella salsuginis]|nr:endonuclease/exonuclease/phosphatase family protein [Zhihengliuella salsuginis]